MLRKQLATFWFCKMLPVIGFIGFWIHLWGDARLSEICLSDLIDLEFVGAKDIITFKLINISNIYHREHSLYLEEVAVHRCSSKQVFVIFAIFAIFTGKHLCWSFFLIKLCWSFFLIKLWAFRPATLLKRDSSTCAFLWILQNI